MARKPTKETSRTWREHVGSKAFHDSLAETLAEEIRYLGSLTLAEVVDPLVVHRAIDAWSFSVLATEPFADILLACHDTAVEVLRESSESPQDLLGTRGLREIERLLFSDDTLGQRQDGFVTSLMREDFTRQLFTEIVFTSIVSFNKKINPFGSFAVRAMEEQIKGFIRLFMPMIQSQAATFALDNQEALRDLGRSLLRQAWDRPLGEHLRAPTAERRVAATALLQLVSTRHPVEELVRRVAHAVWDALLASTSNIPLGGLFDVERNADALGRGLADIVAPFLLHPSIAAWIPTGLLPSEETKPLRKAARKTATKRAKTEALT